MRRWSQDRDVPKLRYQPELDSKNKGWHYLWEGAGFGVQVSKTGKRHWMHFRHAASLLAPSETLCPSTLDALVRAI
jgi:hypothetical protein